MNPERCLYTLIHAPRERHEPLLHELVLPVVAAIRARPELDSLFFVRYSDPDWQLRFRVLGRPEWVDGEVRGLVESGLRSAREREPLLSFEFATYQREWERYGGEEGMRLCEKLFFHDSLGVLELIEADREGLLLKSRREYSMVFVERLLDLLRFERDRRVAFYLRGHSWAFEGDDAWRPEDVRVLEERYLGLKEGLLALFRDAARVEPAALFGGEAPARVALSCLEAMRPVVNDLLAAHAAGRIRQDLVDLAWSLAHMHCNRLALEPGAEAILRFFMYRLHQDEAIV